jgi:hypothetical protein
MRRFLRPWLSRDFEREPLYLQGEGRDFAFDVLIPGAIAGLVGGLGFLLMLVALLGLQGDPWLGPKLISTAAIRGVSPGELGIEGVVVGIGLHLGISVGLGVTLATLLPLQRLPAVGTAAMGLLFAALAYVVLFYFVAWAVARPLVSQVNPTSFFLCHLPFGAAMALVNPMRGLRPWFSRRARGWVRHPAEVQ